jgi:hypothetical protein
MTLGFQSAQFPSFAAGLHTKVIINHPYKPAGKTDSLDKEIATVVD